MKVVEGIADVDDLDAFLAAVDDVRERTGATVQVFDARYVVGESHLRRALELADRARERGEAVARDRAVELLVYAAGRRQIDRALTMGVSEGRTPVVAVVDADGRDNTGGRDSADGRNGAAAVEADAAEALADLLEPAATLGDCDPALVREFFDVGDAELAATDGDLADVVLERVALLDVEK